MTGRGRGGGLKENSSIGLGVEKILAMWGWISRTTSSISGWVEAEPFFDFLLVKRGARGKYPVGEPCEGSKMRLFKADECFGRGASRGVGLGAFVLDSFTTLKWFLSTLSLGLALGLVDGKTHLIFCTIGRLKGALEGSLLLEAARHIVKLPPGNVERQPQSNRNCKFGIRWIMVPSMGSECELNCQLSETEIVGQFAFWRLAC